MAQLYLVGTSHLDRVRGPAKLIKLYDELKPDIIFSEMNQDGLDRHMQRSEQIRSAFERLAKENDRRPITNENIDGFIELYLSSIGFEWKTNISYAKEHDIEHHMIMPSGIRFADKLSAFMSNALITEAESNKDFDLNAKIEYLREKLNIAPEKIEQKWETILKNEGKLKGEAALLAIGLTGYHGKKDKEMEPLLRGFYDLNKVIAGTLGMYHISDSIFKRSLYSKVMDLNPERIPLL